jgi:membrane associated rhomboid family serine protease
MRRWLWRLRGLFFLAPATTTLVAVCLVVFWIQQTASRVEFAQIYGYRITFGQSVESCFSLSLPLLSKGFVWQLFTYMFLHDGFWHLFFNLLTVVLFGAGLESEVGRRRFWRIFLTGGVIGGLGWLTVTALMPMMPPLGWLNGWMPQALRAWMRVPPPDAGVPAACMGASGGVFALIGAFAALFPNRCVYFLLFFFIPVRPRARAWAWSLGALTVLEAVFVQSQVAYSAHLAGGLAGYLYGLRLSRSGLFGREE